MRRWVQIPNDEVASEELQPVAKLSITVEELTDRGLSFTREDDDLGDVDVAALRAGEIAFLLRRYTEDPVPGVAVHTITAGDSTEQLAELMGALRLTPGDVLFRWDGHAWHASTTNSAASRTREN